MHKIAWPSWPSVHDIKFSDHYPHPDAFYKPNIKSLALTETLPALNDYY